MEVPFGSGLELAIICRLQCEAGAGRLLIYDFDGALSCQFTVPGGKSLLRGLRVLGGESKRGRATGFQRAEGKTDEERCA